ncbi:hypothetical protein [Maribacter sp.]|uniref:hypothetical protein n=1 Tax=Maribacter sp. TaxID=1897614 RepID=UPI0025C10912|nr:hypothetical protein [Maribacter sp.]
MVTIIQKLLTFILLLLLSALLNSCQEEQKKEIVTEKVRAPKQIIPVAQAENMYKNYSERRVSLIQRYEDSINKKSGIKKEFDVARFVSYDYKTIKQYLAYIEDEAKKADIDISTLRFYFSNYPDKQFFDNKDSILHPRQNSIMLSPTIRKGNRDYLFYISGTQEKQEAILLSNSFAKIKGIGANKEKTKAYASFLSNYPNPNTSLYAEKSVTMNRGHNTPPKEQ